MGHSMGGGATYLAGAGNTQVATTITFAAAQTDPKATTAALTTSVPSLVLSGELDNVVKPDTQRAIYTALGANLKYHVTLKQGTHCFFASTASLCEIGESTPSGALTRSVQNQRVIALTEPWLNFHLKGNCNEFLRFTDTLSAYVATTKATEIHTGTPIPTVTASVNASTLTAITTTPGANFLWSNGATTATTTATGSGTYTVTVTAPNGCTASAAVGYVGINEQAAFTQIRLFPNPTSSNAQLDLQLTAPSQLTLNITDAAGKLIFTDNIAENKDFYQLTLPTATLTKGLYFINVRTNQGSWTGKLTVE
jgi:Secretion system C-terminal sorting domain/Dienelactone hydrolase family